MRRRTHSWRKIFFQVIQRVSLPLLNLFQVVAFAKTFVTDHFRLRTSFVNTSIIPVSSSIII